jgi:hypothetical protein
LLINVCVALTEKQNSLVWTEHSSLPNEETWRVHGVSITNPSAAHYHHLFPVVLIGNFLPSLQFRRIEEGENPQRGRHVSPSFPTVK